MYIESISMMMMTVKIIIIIIIITSARQLLCDLGRKISEHTGKSEKRAFCFKGARCSCNVSIPYYFTTVYLPLTAPAD